ncbi:MAG: hypothetical protein COT81_03170 [Candidatus Buchananbacteria bacterium CG10_big_fil_rev_8_21_14_0_10_42_9]|uniref:EamA domain-containing protein n=1 Tax=Candidatus Buchananbacteria bacterium CG10_big_fil_rev_8_21_14_0_10_42_9 TaxID=1974526 RepID=A0A2H0W3C5_9BACT|nr:MAG: hypothetical protein COT81_03170 [Candidatus Buchananbacteria bacterium CG10_big_fil_rev_8_21_14_0_10_42_9]
MNWIFLSLSAYLMWAGVTVADKYIITNRIRHHYVYMTMLMQISIIVAVALVPLVDFYLPPWRIIFWLLLAGALAVAANLIYIKAANSEDITRINMLFSIIPIFTLLLAVFFIDEKLSFAQLTAFIVLVVGTALACFHVGAKQITVSNALPMMVVVALFYAINIVIFKFVVESISYTNAFIWGTFTYFPFAHLIFFSKKFRTQYRFTLAKINTATTVWLIGIGVVDSLGALVLASALALGPATLVNALNGSQTIFAFILALVITLIKPVLKEEFDSKNLFLKFLALVIITFGTVILNLPQ